MTLGQGNLLNNRYRIVDILGRGGMGAVYHATDESLGVDVAVKENLFTTDDYARQFRMEAVILAGLRHPNLPRVTDHFVVENMGQYLVMDYIEGDDLRQILEKSGPLTEDQAIRVGVSACDALSYLHSRKPPILHRDIKLGNIKISSDGSVHLVDFGLAKMAWENEETMTGARAMTPGYSPPEQYGTARTDARSDIYSLGATLYASLTGIIPEDSLMRAVDGVALTPLREHRPEITSRLAEVIEKALETTPINRYQSAESFKRALLGQSDAATITEKPVTVVPPPADPPPPISSPIESPQPKRRLPVWRLIGILLFFLLVAIAAMMVNPLNRNQVLALLAPLDTATFSPTIVNIFPATMTGTKLPVPVNTPTITVSPTPTITLTPILSSTEIMSASPTVLDVTVTSSPTVGPTALGGGPGEVAYSSIVDNVAQIFLVNADGSNLRQLTHDLNGACDFDWSPDGKKLVYISPCKDKLGQYYETSLYFFDVETGQTISLPSSSQGDFDPVWSPDGTKIAFSSLRDGGFPQIFVMELDLEKPGSSEVTQLTFSADTPDRNVQSRYPAWSPDGTQIVYTMRRVGLLQLWTMSADGSNKKQILRTGGGFSDYLPVWSPDGTYILFSETNSSLTAPASLLRLNIGADSATPLPAPLPVVDVHFSPDGQWIAYETSDTKNQDIYLYNLLDGKRQRLTTSEKTDFDPVWQP